MLIPVCRSRRADRLRARCRGELVIWFGAPIGQFCSVTGTLGRCGERQLGAAGKSSATGGTVVRVAAGEPLGMAMNETGFEPNLEPGGSRAYKAAIAGADKLVDLAHGGTWFTLQDQSLSGDTYFGLIAGFDAVGALIGAPRGPACRGVTDRVGCLRSRAERYLVVGHRLQRGQFGRSGSCR